MNNHIRPKKLILQISEPISNCGKDFIEININFNNITYSTNLKFDTKSTLINVTMVSDFESFIFSIGRFKIENSDDTDCFCILGICGCIEIKCDENNKD